MYKLCFAAVAAMLVCTTMARADDAYYSTSMALGDSDTTEHEDADPFKGYLYLTVYNSGLDPWGDFHLEFYQVTGAIDNVDWIVDSPFQPTSSQSGLTWAVDNVAVGATLDLYFYSDPILPGDTATFTIYTDNTTDHVSFFGVSMYPTPVPEPGTLVLMGLAGACLYYPRRRR